MKKEVNKVNYIVLGFLILILFYISMTISGGFGEAWKKITGNVVSTENFDNTIDANKWNQITTSLSFIENGKLKCIGNSNSWSDSGLTSNGKWKLSGDFDIQVDYDATSQPTPTSSIELTALGIYGSTYQYSIYNYKDTTGKYAIAGWATQPTSNPWGNTFANAPSSGKFRIQRIGTTINGYRWDLSINNWNIIATMNNGDTSDIYVNIFVRNNGDTGGKIPSATFDNFIINSGTIVSPVSLVSSFVPSSVNLNDKFQIKCDFGSQLGCIQAYHNGIPCSWGNKWEGTAGVFNCVSNTIGVVENRCDLFNYAQDSRCVYQTNKIESTTVIAPQCNPSWVLGSWSTCSAGIQTRTVTDSNNCGITSGKPATSQSCSITPTCIDSDGGLNYTFYGSTTANGNTQNDYCIDQYTLNEKYCSGNTILSQTKVCPNGCKNGKCIINLSETITKKNTLIFGGVYPDATATMTQIQIINTYADKFSTNINGYAGCCNFQTLDRGNVIKNYHSKGYLVMTHIGDTNSALQAARDGVDIIIFDEVKWNNGAISGSTFNNIRSQIKAINPDIKVGIVEPDISYYNSWYNEGANPDTIGLEQYINSGGGSTGGYPSYDVFKSQVINKFPNAKVHIWINNPNQINQFIGKVDYIILFGIDSTPGTFGLGSLFKLSDFENEIKNIYGTIPASLYLNNFAVSSTSVNVGEKFQIKCDFGISMLGCVQAKHGDSNCVYSRYVGNNSLWNCTATTAGIINNYCNLFDSSINSRCKNQTNEIDSINAVNYSDEFKNIRSVTWYPFPYDIPAPEYYDLLERELPKIKANGFNTIWTINTWKGYDPSPLINPHVYNETQFAGLKRVLDLLKRNEVKIIIGLNYLGPSWAPNGINTSNWIENSTQYNAFETYVQDFMKRNINYSNMIYYLVFTESAEPTKLYLPCYRDGNKQSCKQIIADLKPTLGSLPTRLPPEIRSKIKIGYHDYTLINTNLGEGDSPIQFPNSFDFLSMYHYPNAESSDASIKNDLEIRYQNFRKLYPNTPMIIGELGANTCIDGGGSERNQARLDLDVINYALEKGMGFNLWSWIPLQDREECKFGDGTSDWRNGKSITYKNGTLKPSAIQIKSLLCNKYDCGPVVIPICNNNNICEAEETKENCPGDCVSTTIACNFSSDCGTNKYLGSLICDSEKKNVMQNYTNFTCNNPGTTLSYCSNITILKTKNSCATNEMCLNAQCKIPQECSECGLFWGVGCTYNSCHGLGNCYYNSGFLTIGSACQNVTEICKTKTSCSDINQLECNNEVCGLNCEWDMSKNICTEKIIKNGFKLGLAEPIEFNSFYYGWDLDKQLDEAIKMNPSIFRIWYYPDRCINNNQIDIANCQIYKNSIARLRANGIEPIMMWATSFPQPITGLANWGETPRRNMTAGSKYQIFLDNYERWWEISINYFPEITYWQTGNEYNGEMLVGPNRALLSYDEKAAITTDLMFRSQRAIKKLNPNAITFAPALAALDEKAKYNWTGPIDFIDRLYGNINSGNWPSKNPADYFDWVSWNPYYSNADWSIKEPDLEWINNNKNLYNEFKKYDSRDLKVYFSEFGFSDSLIQDDFKKCADFTNKSISLLKEQNLPWLWGITWHLMLDHPEILNTWGSPALAGYGVMQNINGNYPWKPSAYVLNSIMNNCTSICQVGQMCRNGNCINSCNPNCINKQCGGDGCSGFCGSCPSGQECDLSGQCHNIIPLCGEGDWQYSLSPTTCPSSGQQTKSWTKIGICNGGINHYDSEIVSCVYQRPTCTNFTYSNWGECTSSGTRTRSVLTSSPADCQEENPQITEQCTYISLCTEADWSSSISPTTCPSSQQQIKSWTKIGQCSGGVNHISSETISCVYQRPTCTNFTYSNWGECTSSGTQIRTLITSSPQNCQGGNPEISRQCTYMTPCTNIIYSDWSDCIDGNQKRTIINSAPTNCSLGTINELDVETCNSSNYVKSISLFDLNIESNKKKVYFKFNNTNLIKLEFSNNVTAINNPDYTIKNGKFNSKSFLIIHSRNRDYENKTIYLNMNESSKGVCVLDQYVEDISQIRSNCTYITCPGIKNKYNCSRLSDNTISVSGLRNSAIMEMIDSTCGDKICTNDESCDSCSVDCGTCYNPGTSVTNVNTESGSSIRSSSTTITSGNEVSKNISNKKTVTNLSGTKVAKIINESPSNSENKKMSNEIIIFIVIMSVLILIILIVITIIIVNRNKKPQLIDVSRI